VNPPRALGFDRLTADQPVLAAALDGIGRAAASEAPVLVLGAPGSGRTSVARAVHAASRRAAAALVEVDPGAVPASLFESELFGHRAGAFTGAAGDQPGRVGRAEAGTLLFDHLEELPLAVQPKLLRLLAEHRYTPLGGEERGADVRFVAVGPDDLGLRVERGAFREDLYYRLEVFAFHLPSLAERRHEILAVAHLLLAELGERFSLPPAWLDGDCRDWMPNHPWPGNLTQLRNLLERELILTGGGRLDPAPPGGHDVVPRPLVEVEADEIRRALAYTRGHQGEAADLLGISRKALWAKRKRLGIP